MQAILSSEQMKQCDANTMEHYGMLSAVLMERAALAAADAVLAYMPEKKKRILIACGVGNNGGDGLAMARLLYLKGQDVTILFPGKEEKCSVEAARQLAIARNYGIPIVRKFPDAVSDLETKEPSPDSGESRKGEPFDVIADALFGIGLSRAIGGVYYDLIRRMNDADAFKLAVDISSGISADRGCVMGIAFRADLTVTFGFAKTGQLLYPGADYTGQLIVRDIGIDRFSLLDIKPELYLLDQDALRWLPERTAHSNKGSYGKLLIFAGSHNMAGAAIFAATAAYRAGAGLVRVVTEESNREIVQNQIPEAVLATYGERTDMEAFVKEQLAWADAVVAGPGIGLSGQARELVETILSHVDVPCLLDADALNLVAKNPDRLRGCHAPLIVTPHLGEMARLTGLAVSEIQENLRSVAEDFANQYHVVTVLKDARTIVSVPGGETYLNATGNHGMATGGSGDVLSGVIGSLLGQHVPPAKAAPLGVLLHGMAGDTAAKEKGTASLMASDLTDGLSGVFKTLDLQAVRKGKRA